MRLFEFEAKKLLEKHGIPIPQGRVFESQEPVAAPCVVKAQVLFGDRARQGGVGICKTQEEAGQAITRLIGSTLQNERVTRVLVEEYLPIEEEYYVGFLFDTKERAPVLLFSKSGGSGIEQKNDVQKVIINPMRGLEQSQLDTFPESLNEIIGKLYDVFVKEDCRLLEINPLAKTKEGVVCVDARVELDEAAKKRREWSFEERSALGRPFTERELRVKEASNADHRGTVKYLELDGDIAVLAAGGGGSLTCMDALISEGGRPANYSEFSGNPSDEKMYVLAKEALTRPGIKGCWIVGAIANFSRVDAMMEGIVKALKEVRPTFPIVVRRAGPYEKEGLALLREAAEKEGWDVSVFGAQMPLTATAKIMVEKAYGNSN